MIGAGIRVTVDTSGFNDLERNTDDGKGKVLLSLAQATEGYIKMAFNSTSPSPAGEPPGIDTGALKNSIIAEMDGDAAVVHDEVEYGIHLEFGTTREGTEYMAPRPFMRPGAVWIVHNLPDDVDKQYVGAG